VRAAPSLARLAICQAVQGVNEARQLAISSPAKATVRSQIAADIGNSVISPPVPSRTVISTLILCLRLGLAREVSRHLGTRRQVACHYHEA
jgi:hypothetical protein